MAGEVEVEGAATLAATLRRFGADLADLEAAHARTGALVGARAASNAPRRTGRLASSMSTDAGPGEAAVSFAAAYAGPMNYGVAARSGMRGPHNIRASYFATRAAPDLEQVWTGYYLSEINTRLSHVRGA